MRVINRKRKLQHLSAGLRSRSKEPKTKMFGGMFRAYTTDRRIFGFAQSTLFKGPPQEKYYAVNHRPIS